MVISAFQFCRTFNRPVVAGLAMWLSGLVCLFCCAATCAASTDHCAMDDSAMVGSVQSEAQENGEHACCAKQRRAEEAKTAAKARISPDGAITTERDPEVCCALKARLTAAVPLPVPPQIPGVELVAVTLPVLIVEPTPIAYPRDAIPPLNRGDTHLRCCVFLI